MHFLTKRKEGQRVSLENGKEYVGGGTGEREIIWKKRASVIERERAREREREEEEEEERKNGAQYTVWRLREGFQRRDREGEQLKGESSEGAREPQPEVIWKRREEEEREDTAGRQGTQNHLEKKGERRRSKKEYMCR